MIVRNRPSVLTLFFILRGSILPRIAGPLASSTALSILATLTHGFLFEFKITLTTIPFSLIGLALAIFLGFRNQTTYDRFWEGRKLWGELIQRCRSLARQCQSLIDAPAPAVFSDGLGELRVRMVLRAIAYAYALNELLRHDDRSQRLSELLLPQEWQRVQRSANRPDALLQGMGADLREAIAQRRVDGPRAAAIDATLTAMATAAAGCERIRSTPIPFSYSLLLHRTAYAYCFLLPFGLVDSIGFMTPFVVIIVAYTFFGLDALGDEIEEPFGRHPNDLPLDAMCRIIEINLLESLDAPLLPPQLQSVDYCLL